MMWSITIITELVFGKVYKVSTGGWQAHKRGMAIIRKIIS